MKTKGALETWTIYDVNCTFLYIIFIFQEKHYIYEFILQAFGDEED